MPPSRSPPPSPPTSVAHRFNELSTSAHSPLSEAGARIFKLFGLGKKFDRIRYKVRLHRARRLKPPFSAMEADNAARVARLARQGAVEVPTGGRERLRLIALGWDEEVYTRAARERERGGYRWEGAD